MGRKGFTLVELTAVVLLIGIIATLAAIPISKMIKDSKESVYDSQTKQIVLAAENWAVDNPDELSNDPDHPTVITVGDLINQDYLEDSIIDSRTEEKIEECSKIIITFLANSESNRKTYKYDYTGRC